MDDEAAVSIGEIESVTMVGGPMDGVKFTDGRFVGMEIIELRKHPDARDSQRDLSLPERPGPTYRRSLVTLSKFVYQP